MVNKNAVKLLRMLPLFKAIPDNLYLEFYVATHNIAGLGIRRLLEGFSQRSLRYVPHAHCGRARPLQRAHAEPAGRIAAVARSPAAARPQQSARPFPWLHG